MNLINLNNVGEIPRVQLHGGWSENCVINHLIFFLKWQVRAYINNIHITQVGKADRLRNKVKPFAALFWALGIVLYLPTPDPAHRGVASLHRRTKRLSLYGHAVCTVHGRELVQFSKKTRCPPPHSFFLSMLLFIYGKGEGAELKKKDKDRRKG